MERDSVLQRTTGKLTILTMLVGVFLSCGNVAAEDQVRSIDEAVRFYKTRHLDPGNLDKSESILKQLAEQRPEDAAVLSELSHVYFLFGERETTASGKLAFYDKGAGFGKKAIALDGLSVDAHFWYVVNLGRIGETKGVLNSLFMLPELRKEVETILKFDPRHTGALDVRACINYEVPGLFGGNISRSIKDLEKALAIDPNDTALYVDMAEAYVRKRDYTKAREYLNLALAVESPSFEADAVLTDRPRATALLEKIKDRK